ncbi:MAG: potassium channel family protein [Gammaproteobacteria bacterium]|nr:potassium channel family protein [Gammaproteobacteria bacterium]
MILDNLLLGLACMIICVLIQGLLVASVVELYVRRQRFIAVQSFLRTQVFIIIVMVALVIGNFLQIAIWAALFMYLKEFEDFSTAIYHSAVNFATLGYGDIVMSEKHRLLGPLQSINGVLMVGVSTAVVMGTFQNALKFAREARKRDL